MSILVNHDTRLLVQGMTGREGLFHTRQMIAYGTKVVAGVTPGKGGEWVEGVPVFDTVKGADLGTEDGRLILDFNFAYNPSCSYDPSWVCPLATPANRLGVRIQAGERYEQPAESL